MWMTVPLVQDGHPRRGIVLATRGAKGEVDAVVVARRHDSAPGADVWALGTAIVTTMAGTFSRVRKPRAGCAGSTSVSAAGSIAVTTGLNS